MIFLGMMFDLHFKPALYSPAMKIRYLQISGGRFNITRVMPLPDGVVLGILIRHA
jgi:hypothetical protein